MSEASVLVNRLEANLDTQIVSQSNEQNLIQDHQRQQNNNNNNNQNQSGARNYFNNRNTYQNKNRNNHYKRNYNNNNNNYYSQNCYQSYPSNSNYYYQNSQNFSNYDNNDQYMSNNNNNNTNNSNSANNRKYTNRNDRNNQNFRNDNNSRRSDYDDRPRSNYNNERPNNQRNNNNNKSNKNDPTNNNNSNNVESVTSISSSTSDLKNISDNKNKAKNQSKQDNNNSKKEQKTSNNNNNNKNNSKQNLTRSEILIDQLKKNKCECMVCYGVIKHEKPIWNCNVCFHIFHLSCIKKWANSPAAKIEENSEKWRCPGCQTILETIPNKYTCFCTKKINPEHENKPYYQLKQLPHSCGEVCGKPLSSSLKFWVSNQQENESTTQTLECKHKCLEICHPGPCPKCESLVTRTCNCGKAKFQVKCSSTKVPACNKRCDKLLNCNLHICERVCHAGDCNNCDIDVEITCYSHSEKKIVKCGSSEFNSSKNSNFNFNCSKKCDKTLACKNHNCPEQCHQGECNPCALTPSRLTNCPCGQSQIRNLLIEKKIIRTSCTDPVPTCDKICSKILPCNSTLDNGEVHTCELKCHTNECPPCEKLVEVKCRCGKESEMVKCCERNQIKLCNRRCQKKKTCSRHQCNEMCCDDKEHICMQICNKILGCGIHKCEELCHKGPCKRCLVASFEERICECGTTIQYPPIRCGTKPLECPNKCSRAHTCEHPVSHNCHWEEKCPPCSYLTSKMCMGNHEIRYNIPCYMKDVSCGMPCGKQLPSCSHKCQKTCHKDICIDLDSQEKCSQPCQKERPHCNHACNAPCHGDSPCPDTVCQELIIAKCKCGLKTKQVKCQQKMYGESTVVFENIASQLKEMLSCKSIDVSSFKNQETLKKKHELDCDEECLIAERNRNIAQALQIDANARPKPIYSEFLKNFAREEPAFASNIENKFETIINESKIAKTKKTLNLPIMKSLERRFIHELATYYGLETISHDPEPYRNVALYASKDKCYLPSILLTQSIDIKLKQPTMPRLAMKQLNQKTSNPIQSNLKVLQYENEPIQLSSAFSALNDEQEEEAYSMSKSQTAKGESKNEIDYFDFTDQ